MVYEVLLTQGAEQDLESIYDYVAEYDSIENAGQLLDRLTKLVADLSHHPDRGSCPKELTVVGIREYRQVLFKPYRLIYRVLDKRVVVYLIVDGRRDMQSLLAERLLGR